MKLELHFRRFGWSFGYEVPGGCVELVVELVRYGLDALGGSVEDVKTIKILQAPEPI